MVPKKKRSGRRPSSGVLGELSAMLRQDHIGSRQLREVASRLAELSEEAHGEDDRLSVSAFVLSETLDEVAGMWQGEVLRTDYETQLKNRLKRPVSRIVDEVKAQDPNDLLAALADLISTTVELTTAAGQTTA